MSNAAKFPMLAAALILLAATDTQAQQSVRPASLSGSAVAAAELHAKAVTLFAQPDRYAEAATLLVRASSLRSPLDQTSVRDLLDAGRLFAYAGDFPAARSALEAAAAKAMAFGQVVTAAHAYLDAAFIAIRQGDGAAMKTLTEKAERLADSPLIAAAQKNEILVRINPSRIRDGSD